MSGSQVIDMHRWRARARVLRPTAPTASTGQRAPGAAGAAGAAGDRTATATVLPLPGAARTAQARDAQDARRAGPPSVFGPVMAFGLLPRSQPEGASAGGVAGGGPAPAPAAVAVGAEDQDAPVRTSYGRASRARHLADARGAARGPRR